MKMKDLLSRLHSDGFNDISERMIRHYINKGLLPEPEKPHANQAIYSEKHLKILRIIGLLKKQNKTWLEIEFELEKLNLIYTDDEGRSEASFREGYMEELQCIEEWSQIDKKMLFFTREELLSQVNCGNELFEYLVDNKVIANKQYYDFSDMHLVRCVYYMKIFLDRDSQNTLNATKRFLEFINKANLLTDELADFTVEYYRSFLFSNLIKSMLFVKAKNISYASTYLGKSAWSWDTTSISTFEHAEELYGMGISADDDFWVKYLQAVNEKGLTINELFEPVTSSPRKKTSMK